MLVFSTICHAIYPPFHWMFIYRIIQTSCSITDTSVNRVLESVFPFVTTMYFYFFLKYSIIFYFVLDDSYLFSCYFRYPWIGCYLCACAILMNVNFHIRLLLNLLLTAFSFSTFPHNLLEWQEVLDINSSSCSLLITCRSF